MSSIARDKLRNDTKGAFGESIESNPDIVGKKFNPAGMIGIPSVFSNGGDDNTYTYEWKISNSLSKIQRATFTLKQAKDGGYYAEVGYKKTDGAEGSARFPGIFDKKTGSIAIDQNAGRYFDKQPYISPNELAEHLIDPADISRDQKLITGGILKAAKDSGVIETLVKKNPSGGVVLGAAASRLAPA